MKPAVNANVQRDSLARAWIHFPQFRAAIALTSDALPVFDDSPARESKSFSGCPLSLFTIIEISRRLSDTRAERTKPPVESSNCFATLDICFRSRMDESCMRI